MKVMNVYCGALDKGLHIGTSTIFVDLHVSNPELNISCNENGEEIKHIHEIDFGKSESDFPEHLVDPKLAHLAKEMSPSDLCLEIIKLLPERGWTLGNNPISLCFNVVDPEASEAFILSTLELLTEYEDTTKISRLRNLVFNLSGSSYFSSSAVRKIGNWSQCDQHFSYRYVMFQLLTYESRPEVFPKFPEILNFIRSVVQNELRVSFINEVETHSGFVPINQYRSKMLDVIELPTSESENAIYLNDRLRYVLRVMKFYAFFPREHSSHQVRLCFRNDVQYHPRPWLFRYSYGQV